MAVCTVSRGPQDFLNVLDERTNGYADFRGNRQYIGGGNLNDNGCVAMVPMDHPGRKHSKIWATAAVTEVRDDPALGAARYW